MIWGHHHFRTTYHGICTCEPCALVIQRGLGTWPLRFSFRQIYHQWQLGLDHTRNLEKTCSILQSTQWSSRSYAQVVGGLTGNQNDFSAIFGDFATFDDTGGYPIPISQWFVPSVHISSIISSIVICDTYPLVMTNSSPWFFDGPFIEIDGLPSYTMVIF